MLCGIECLSRLLIWVHGPHKILSGSYTISREGMELEPVRSLVWMFTVMRHRMYSQIADLDPFFTFTNAYWPWYKSTSM